MIRERVSTQGVIRPLEHQDDLPAFTLPAHLVGVIPERVLSRYMSAKHAADAKFASTIRNIEKMRRRNIERACRELAQQPAGGWRREWALDQDERPPPSSIVGRLDTEEALRFAGAAGTPQGWKGAGAAALLAVWFAAKVQRASGVEKADHRAAACVEVC